MPDFTMCGPASHHMQALDVERDNAVYHAIVV